MKSFLLLICSAFIFGSSTSESDNFKISNGQVIWQKVYNTNLTNKQLIETMKISGYFEDIEMVNEKKLTAKIKQLSPDYKTYGLSYWSTPALICLYDIKAFSVIEFKEKQYRVTLKSIELVKKERDSLDRQITEDIEYEILNKDNTAFRSYFLKESSKILDFTFQKITDFDKILEDDQW